MTRGHFALIGAWALFLALLIPAPAAATPRLALSPCEIARVAALCGTHDVPEDRAAPGGRTLPLRVVLLPALAARKDPEPVYFLSGGPGQAATDSAADLAGHWLRETRDIVLVDARGTGTGHALDCDLGPSDANPQAYLEPLFRDTAAVRACREALSTRADLRLYATHRAMEDLDEVRGALGHERIMLVGISYGSRAALTYIRMFGRHVRGAWLSGIVAFENRSPLYHAAAAQRAFDLLARQCAADPACAAAYPDMAGDLRAVIARLRAAPATVRARHPATGAPVDVMLTESGFGDGLRVMLYSAASGRRVPLLLRQARAGDLTPFAEAALRSSRNFHRLLRTGLLLSVSCAEDAARIRPEEVDAAVGDSFIGPWRVRGQLAACALWPRAPLPADQAEPVRSDVPVLLVSGDLDPVTPPEWGELVVRHLRNGRHIVAPGAHGEGGDCVDAIGRAFFRTASVAGLDTSCLAGLALPPFLLPETAADR